MRKIILSIFTVVCFTVPIFAQFGSVGAVNARSMGMAKTYNSTSRGIYSLGINPSNLMYKKNSSIDFSTILPLPYLSLRTGTDFMSINDVNYFFGGVNGNARYLSSEDKQRFNNLFENGGFVFSNITTNLLSAAYKYNAEVGAFAFAIKDVAAVKLNFPQAVIDIVLTGNPVGKNYNLNDTEIQGWWLREYSLSYARDLPEINQSIFDKISAGISLKLVHGFSYVGTDKVNTSFSTLNDNRISGSADLHGNTAFSDNFGVKYDYDSVSHNSNFSIFPSPAGSGFGMDIGFSAEMNHVWHFALAVTDIGSISWSKNAAEFYSNGQILLDDVTDQAQRDSLVDKLIGTSSPVNNFSTSLPTALRMGASYLFNQKDDAIPGTLMLALDYNQGFNKMPGNSTSPRISVGAEWKPADYVPFIRTGFSFGGVLGFHWGFGLGFDAKIVEFDFATSDLQGFLFPNSAEYVSISFGSRWKF